MRKPKTMLQIVIFLMVIPWDTYESKFSFFHNLVITIFHLFIVKYQDVCCCIGLVELCHILLSIMFRVFFAILPIRLHVYLSRISLPRHTKLFIWEIMKTWPTTLFFPHEDLYFFNIYFV